jgi:threonylcarbamoyladenosine tRNA methylthiotransferase MtaB
MRNEVQAAGLNQVVVVNTCAVTAEAEKQARQEIRKIRRQKPDAQIIATGCAVQIDPDSWANLPEIDGIIGNQEKLTSAPWANLKQAIADGQPAARAVSSIMEAEQAASHLVESFEDHTRGFLQVQQGCDHRCTFCIIPFGRGKSRSVSVDAVIAAVRKMVSGGTREIVLSGIDITSWGRDLPEQPRLGQLVLAILDNVPELPRLRLSSLDPAEPDHYLMTALETHARLMPHLHLSVQHGDDLILKRMKRRHLARDVLRFCEEARRRRPEVVFGADLIAGFPTEIETAHKNSIKLIKEASLTHLHVFGYSARKGTPAALMPQLDRFVIKQRVSALRQSGDEQLAKHLERRVGTADMLLLEKGKEGYLSGYEKAQLAKADLQELKAGDLVAVNILSAANGVVQVTPLCC